MIPTIYVLAAIGALALSIVAFVAHLRGAYGVATVLLLFAGWLAVAGASSLLYYGEFGIWYSLLAALAYGILTFAEGIKWMFRHKAASPP